MYDRNVKSEHILTKLRVLDYEHICDRIAKCHKKILFITRVNYIQILDFDLDSSRIQLDTLGHTPTPSVSVKSCHLCFLPGEPHLS